MQQGSRWVVSLVFWLGLSLGASKSSPAAGWIAQDAQSAPISAQPTGAIVELILAQGESVDLALLAELGRRRDRLSMNALMQVIEKLKGEAALDAACMALVECVGESTLAADCVAFLARWAEAPAGPCGEPATRALAACGALALQPLQRILSQHEVPVRRRIAIGGVLPYLRSKRDEASLKLLIEWYRVPESGSRAGIVAALADFSDAQFLPLLKRVVTSSKADPQIRSIVVEALAGMAAAGVRELLRDALAEDEPSVQLAALDGLARLGERQHAPELERYLRSRDLSVRAAAFAALGTIYGVDAQWKKRVLAAARGRDYSLRGAAAAMLVHDADPQAQAALLALLEDPYPCVRQRVLDCIYQRRELELVPHLIDRLRVESQRLRPRVWRALCLITGLDHGQNPARWLEWWQQEGHALQLPELAQAEANERQRSSQRAQQQSKARFYGIELASDRICFVLDTSGSMAELVNANEMRIDIARRELLGALRDLPDGTQFNVVFFADDTRAWQRHLCELTPATRAAAGEFVRRQGAGGATALYDGLHKALEDPAVDTIVLLSDGEPTAGRMTEPQQILEAMRSENQLRQIVFHCVALPGAGAFLRELAESNGGIYKAVR